MCNAACLAFGRSRLTREEIQGRTAIEVGSRDVNGSLRADLERLGAASVLGVDVVPGPGVDEICDVGGLHARYGAESFDVVVATELLEHVRDWRRAVSNLKRILKPNGVLLVTTRSRGFPYHGHPHDFWRFEADDIRTVLGDLVIQAIERDPLAPGVFVKAVKPADFAERDLGPVALYSVVSHRRCRDVSGLRVAGSRVERGLRRALSRMRGHARRAVGR